MKNISIKNVDEPVNILLVDSDQNVIDSFSIFLKRLGFPYTGTTDPYKAIELVRDGGFDLLIIDYLLSPINAEKVVSEIRKFNIDLYILLLTGYSTIAPPVETLKKLDIQAYCEKQSNFSQLELLIISASKSIRQIRRINEYQEKLNKSYADLNKSYFNTIQSLILAVEEKDEYTRGHSDRVAILAKSLGETLGLSKKECADLYTAGLFHDIGKIGIDESILRKPSKLTDEEYALIKEHPIKSVNILSPLTNLKSILPAVRGHHERYDGRGYPDGLAGENIPYKARVLAVVDAFDAMTTDRKYNKIKNIDTAKKEILDCAGKQFDPDIARVFVKMLNNNPSIIKKLPYFG